MGGGVIKGADMSEQKVWVEKMPESCWDCFCQNSENGCCKMLNKYTDYVPKDCPLIDIKAHDRELVKEVCEKIIRLAKLQNNDNFYIMTGCIIDEIRKEYEK